MLIRLLSPADAELLGDLLTELDVDGDSRHFHPHPLTRAEAVRIAAQLPHIKDRYFGAFADNQLLGYGMLRGWDEGYSVPAFGVAVRPAARGRGIGRMLLRYAIELAKSSGAQTMMLKVHGDNPSARRLYESEGFTFTEPPMPDGQVRGLLALWSE